MRWLLISFLALMSHLALASSIRHEAYMVRILQKSTGSQLCSGIMLEGQKILTARHCFVDDRPDHYLVMQLDAKRHYEIASLHFYEKESRFFPNLDIAILQLKTSLPDPPEKIQLWTGRRDLKVFQMEVWSSGLSPSCQTINCAGQKKITKLRNPNFFEGHRIKSLFTASSRQNDVCIGDSGAPVLLRTGGRWYVFGVLNGLWDPLTSTAGTCSAEAVYTALDTYRPWITSLVRQDTKSGQKNWTNLEDACRQAGFTNAQDLAVQALVVEVLDYSLVKNNPAKALKIYQTCEGLNHEWKTAVNDSRRFRLPVGIDLAGLDFIKQLTRVELQSVDKATLEIMNGSTALQELVLLSSTEAIDISEIQLPGLKTLSIKHFDRLRGLSVFLDKHIQIENIELVDIANLDDPRDKLHLSTFSRLKSLKNLTLGMVRVERDFTFNPKTVTLRVFKERSH